MELQDAVSFAPCRRKSDRGSNLVKGSLTVNCPDEVCTPMCLKYCLRMYDCVGQRQLVFCHVRRKNPTKEILTKNSWISWVISSVTSVWMIGTISARPLFEAKMAGIQF